MNTSQKSSIPNSLHKNAAPKILLLGALFLLSALLGVTLGSTVLDLPGALSGLLRGDQSGTAARILLHVRLPRVSATLLAGSALAVSGALLQAVLANPLASPNVIGVNAGAGFFTFLCISLFPGALALAPLGAFFGALLATLIVWVIAAKTGAGKTTLVLAGVAVSSIFTAGINTIKTFFPDTLYNGSTFLIGGFAGVSFANLSPAWILILLALALSFCMARQTDVLCLGEETAQSLGMNVRAVRFFLILLACVLAGAAVSFAGLIGFAGLIVPHIARRLFGPHHRVLLPASCLLGGAFVTLCDLLSRLVFAPYEIPVGILMSLIGGPFFLFLILSRRKGGRKGGRHD